jgi:multidrug efflux system outer membrane protein
MNRRIYISIALLLGLFFLDACKVGPNYQKIEVPTETNYRFNTATTEADTVLNLRWWELFNDPVLDTLIVVALEQNKDVLIAASRIEQARAKLGFTKADMWPKIDYSGNYSNGNLLLGQSVDGTQENIFAGASLSWELDFWGKFRRANESERANLLATEYGYRSVQMGLISTVANSYFQLLDFKMRLEISEKTLDMRDSSLYIIEQRFEYGIIPAIDVNQAEIQRAIAASSIPQYERRVAQTENALSVVLGINPGAIEIGKELIDQPLPDTIPTGLPSILLERRPDILQAEQNVVAQNALIGVAVAQRFPSISLTGILGVASNEFSSLFTGGAAWSVGGNLLGPLFHFNKNKRRVDIERAKTEQSVYSYELTVLNAFREVEDALVGIETLKRELSARGDQMNAAVNARELSAQRYDKGVTSYLEVLETQRSAFDAELLYSGTLQQLFNSYINLYNALGGGWVSDAEEQEAIRLEQERAAEEAAKGQ